MVMRTTSSYRCRSHVYHVPRHVPTQLPLSSLASISSYSTYTRRKFNNHHKVKLKETIGITHRKMTGEVDAGDDTMKLRSQFIRLLSTRRSPQGLLLYVLLYLSAINHAG